MEFEQKARVRILVAAALTLVRAGLCALITPEPRFSIVGETGEQRELVSLVAFLKPDVLIIEAELLGHPVGELITEIMVANRSLAVVILLAPEHASSAPMLLASGAIGCFLKSDRPSEFLRGVHAAADGELAMSSSVGRLLVGHLNEPKRNQTLDSLTERERDIFDQLAAGLSNREIAQKLYLSVRTVEVHLRNIYGKLGVRSRLQAVTRRTLK